MLECLTKLQLQEYVVQKGLPKFRANQIFDAIKQAKSLSEISNISKKDLDLIEKDFPKYSIFKKFEGSDGTKKYLIMLEDGNIIECVLMSYKYGKTLCLSTQVGCRMGCKFFHIYNSSKHTQ